MWRFLQLRGFVDEEHRLTTWGKVLEATLSASGPKKAQEEAAFLAVELLRLGLLNADTMFRDYSGAPMRGSGKKFRSFEPGYLCLVFNRYRQAELYAYLPNRISWKASP